MNFPREEIIKEVLKNMGSEEAKDYFDKSRPGHDAAVQAVTQLLENYHNEPAHPHMGLTEISEREIRRELYNDNRTVEQQVSDILNGHDEKWSKAYFDNNHPQHREAVQRVSILAEAKFDNQPHAPEVMPLITRTGSGNIQQGEVIDHGFQNSNEGDA